MSYTGLDIGQTGCKAVAFDDRGGQVAASYREYRTIMPREGWAEIDSGAVKESCFEVLREVNRACEADPVNALAISCQGEAFTPVGPKGEYLANAMITFDTRAAEIAAAWSGKFGVEKLYTITGHTAHPMFSVFKLLWFRDNEPGLFRKASKFLCFEDLLQHALGLEPRISYCLAARTMMYDVRAHRWDETILRSVGVESARFAVPVPSGTKIGAIPHGISGSLGFRGEVIVAAGGHDQPMGALGAGVVEPGKAMYATGTSEAITPVFPKAVFSDELMKNNICTYEYTLDGMYTTVAFSLTGGNILRWFRDQWGQMEVEEAVRRGIDAYELLLAKIGSTPTKLLLLPYFTPSGTPYFDTETAGALFGLRLSTKREEVLRALLEGVALEMRLNLEILGRSGISIGELRAIGGGAKSRAWVQLKADVLNKPITTVQVTEAACFAGAMFACSARTGEPAASVAKRWVKTGSVLEPNPENAAAYDEKFASYVKLYPAVKALGLKGGRS
jgi:xylulokinase